MGGAGAMIVFTDGKLRAIPFMELTDQATGKTRLRYVDIHSESFMVARNYMIRLEKRDFEKERIKTLAKAAKMTITDFRKRFSYIPREDHCPVAGH